MKTVNESALQQLNAARTGTPEEQKAYLQALNTPSDELCVVLNTMMNDDDLNWLKPLALELFLPAVDIVFEGMGRKCKVWEQEFLDEDTNEMVPVLRCECEQSMLLSAIYNNGVLLYSGACVPAMGKCGNFQQDGTWSIQPAAYSETFMARFAQYQCIGTMSAGEAFLNAKCDYYNSSRGIEEDEIILAVSGVHKSNIARHIRLLVAVEQPLSTATQRGVVPAPPALVDANALPCVDIDSKDVAANGVHLIASKNHIVLVGIKSKQIHHHPVTGSELPEHLSIGAEQI